MTVMERLARTVIEKLEEGVVPWHQPWNGGGVPGYNVISNKRYKGYNWLATILSGYKSKYWLTYKQARELGGYVNKGEKGTPIYFFKFIEDNEDPDNLIPFVRYYTVFNVLQCTFPDEDMLPGYLIQDLRESQVVYNISEAERIQRADEIWERWENKPRLNFGGGRAYYSPVDDKIQMPMFEDFESPDHYYTTLFHEAIHATGAKHRLNRDSVSNAKPRKSIHQYGIEELIAEIGAMRLNYEARIAEHLTDHNAAYIDHWLKAIKEKPSIIFRAANAADKAASYILEDTIGEE